MVLWDGFWAGSEFVDEASPEGLIEGEGADDGGATVFESGGSGAGTPVVNNC